MAFNIGAGGELLPYTAGEIAAMELRTFGVKDGSHPTMSLGQQSTTIRREWLCKWTRLEDAICALLGGAAIYSGGSGFALSRVMPMAVPGFPNCLAMEIENVQGHGSAGINDANGMPAYKYARLMVRHELAYFQQAADSAGVPEYARYVESLPSTTDTNYLTLPGSMLKYRVQGVAADTFPLTPQGYPIPFNVGRTESVKKLSKKWHRVPKSAWQPGSDLHSRIHGNPTTGERGYIGTVNKTPLFGYPAGTLLFMGVDEEMVSDPTVIVPGGIGDFAFNLTYLWLAKTTGGGLSGTEGFGHNYLYWGGTPGDAILAGYYLATKNSTWLANGSLTDGICLFDEREHADLYNVGA